MLAFMLGVFMFSLLSSFELRALFADWHNVAEKTTQKKLPAAAAWEPGSGKHTVNFTKSSQSIGKYTGFWHVPKREIQQSTVRVHKMKKMHLKKAWNLRGR